MAKTKQTAAYGLWASPLSAKALSGDVRLNDVQWDSDGKTLVWLEGRGAQGVLVTQSGIDAPRDLTRDLSVRGRVGYGGGDFTVANGVVYFAGPEGRLYRQSIAGGSAEPITPAFGVSAAPRVSADGKWLLFVHHAENVDGLAMVDTEGYTWPRKVAFGMDFVMQPAWSPDGQRIAYIAWDFPEMPWDGTELRLATLDYTGGAPQVTATETIAGSETIAIFQPEFSPDGRYLSYVSDESGWGQIYLYDLAAKTHNAITDAQAEHGSAAWAQGQRVYGWSGDGKAIFYLLSDKGFSSLWCYDMRARKSERVSALDDYTDLDQTSVSPRGDQIALLASSSAIAKRVITYTVEPMNVPERLAPAEFASLQMIVDESQSSGIRIHARSSTETLSKAALADAQPIEWPGHDGETVYGLYYAPTSERFTNTGAPPLIVNVHGGPSGQRIASYNGQAQFFASRGFAYIEINYRGSTGYGKAYLNKLRGAWGLYDVEDSATGAQYLAAQGLADPKKFVVMGGSAGGYTVLQSLVDKPGFYRAGVCLYGISDQFMLVRESQNHKFESRYNDSLLGVLPEAADLYRERSPLFHAHKIKDPVIVFQGADDVVVPKTQSDAIVATLKARGVPHQYIVYEGEGHGFRKPENIEDFYNRTMIFLEQYVIYA